MPLTVYSCVTYVPYVSEGRTQEHWAALHFAKAIKRTPLAGYASLPSTSGDTVRIDRTTATAAPLWFADRAFAAAPWPDLVPCGLVPVPDARCDLQANRRSHTYVLADALASALGGDVAVRDLLRWCRPMSPAHNNEGSRDPQVLYGRLRLTDRTIRLAGQRLVLVDDVVASGAHLRAAAAFLADWRADVTAAICAARASETLSTGQSPLATAVDTLRTFESDPDWLLPEVVDGIEL